MEFYVTITFVHRVFENNSVYRDDSYAPVYRWTYGGDPKSVFVSIKIANGPCIIINRTKLSARG